jgi:hypothetical protein
MATRTFRLTDSNYPNEPVDVQLNTKDGLITLEDEDGESVALSQPQMKQLIDWLEQFRKDEQTENEQAKLAQWNALVKRAQEVTK